MITDDDSENIVQGTPLHWACSKSGNNRGLDNCENLKAESVWPQCLSWLADLVLHLLVLYVLFVSHQSSNTSIISNITLMLASAPTVGAPQHCCPTRLSDHPILTGFGCCDVSVSTLQCLNTLSINISFIELSCFTSVIDQYGLKHAFLDILQHAPSIFLQAYAISICEDLQSLKNSKIKWLTLTSKVWPGS